MHHKLILRLLSVLALAFVAIIAISTNTNGPQIVEAQDGDTQGSLQAVDQSGKPRARCPLKHTDVKAEISGFLARVVVTQEFTNPFKEKIEAVYTFPLPHNAAVDDMT
ncbi:MAG TPA: VIT domain-containing protein, partial [Pyrinomonadaceae bacterium]|nr:VIT domain-containing protein [Pyrinomonadaceae bacterium]